MSRPRTRRPVSWKELLFCTTIGALAIGMISAGLTVGQSILIVAGSIFVVLVGTFIVIFLIWRNKKGDPSVFETREEVTRREEFQKKLSSSQTKKRYDESFLPVEFKGLLEEDAICGICKLKMRQDQEILQCPTCKSLFHKDHLEEWLKSNITCPVCKRRLIIK